MEVSCDSLNKGCPYWTYAASYEMRIVGSVFSVLLALPWSLLIFWPGANCPTVTFPSEGNPAKFTKMLQEKKGKVKDIIIFLLPEFPATSSFDITATSVRQQRTRQAAVKIIMLLVAAIFSAQMMDIGRYGVFDAVTGLFAKGLREKMKDPEGTYAREEIWILFTWLYPEEVKLMRAAAAPITLLLCLPLYFLNRKLSFVNLGLMSLLLIPMGLFYAFLSSSSTIWLLLLAPGKVSQLSLSLR